MLGPIIISYIPFSIHNVLVTESQACFKFNLIFGGILRTVSDIQRKMATAEILSDTLFERSASVVDKK